MTIIKNLTREGTRIKSLTLENFGPFQGKHKITFAPGDIRNLTVVIGSSHYGIGPPSHYGGQGVMGEDKRFELTSMISYGIRHALGQTTTKDLYGMDNFKDWPKIFPEHYYKNAKASVEIVGETPAINEENEILYFFSANHSRQRHLTELMPSEESFRSYKIESSSDIPEKFLTQEVADEMNYLCTQYLSRYIGGQRYKQDQDKLPKEPEGETAILLLAKLIAIWNYKFVLQDGQIKFHDDEGEDVLFNADDMEKMYVIGNETKASMDAPTDYLDVIAFILFAALRKVHLDADVDAGLPGRSFAVIQGGWGHFKRNTLRSFFNILLSTQYCSQVIFLDDYPVWVEEPYYDKGVGELPESKRRLHRIYNIDHTGEDEEILTNFRVAGVKYPIYLDSHATTPVDPKVFGAMKPYFTENFGNASSLDHPYGYDASVAVQSARETIAKAIGASMDEIIFTSGATESDNLALIGVMEKNKEKGNHLITCVTEHKAILDTAKYLEKNGCDVTYLPVDEYGEINLNELKNAITDKTVLISIMAANNEIGTIAPLEEIGKIAHENDVLFHTDAAQAVGHIPIDVKKMNIDLMSFSSHKTYGPKGIGALYVRSLSPRVKLDSIVHGGGQERNIRSGTLNVPGIVGFAAAVDISIKEMDVYNKFAKLITDAIRRQLENVGGILNGHPDRRLAHNLNMRFDGIESKAIINSVSKKVAISAGSACTTDVVEPSHVLLAIGLNEEQSHQSIRIGLSRFTSGTEAMVAAEEICDAIEAIRKIQV